MAEVPEQHKESRQLQDVKAARTLFEKVSKADDKRRKVRRSVTNQLDGGRPMDQADLDLNAESWRSNFNPGDALAAESKTLLPYWEARNATPNTINAIVHTGSQKGEVWGTIYEECFTLFAQDWGMDGDIESRLIDKQYIRFGAGFMFFKNDKSPRGESMSAGRILFPEDTKLQTSKWDGFFIRDTIGATELAKLLKTKSTKDNAKHLGWNLDAVTEVLRHADKELNGTTDPRDDEEILDEIVANVIVTEKLWPRVPVVYFYILEEEGKIGKYLFTVKPGGTDKFAKDAKADDFLFVKKDYENDAGHIIAPIFYEVGNGKIHAVKGFGIRNFDWSNILARMKNRAVDGTVFDGMNFQLQTDLTQEGPPIENYGALNVFPAGMTLLNNPGNNNNNLRMIQFMENNMAENNAIYKEQGNLIAESETARQADILDSISSRVEIVNISLYLSQYAGSIYSEQFRRLRKKGSDDPDAKLFKERCLERGMPEEAFHELFVVVQAGNDTSGGTPAARDRLWMDTHDRLAGRPGVNQRWLDRNFVANRHGPRAVEKAFLPEGSETDKFGTRQAKMENPMMAQAIPMDVIAQDDHIAHIPEHMKAMGLIVNEFIKTQKLKNPDQMIFIQLVMPHIDKHFAFIEKDETLDIPRGKLQKEYNKLKKIAENMVDQFAQKLEQRNQETSNG